MHDMKNEVPPETMKVEPYPSFPTTSYSERRKMCQCDCYQAELLVKLCPLLETIKTDDPKWKDLLGEALRYKDCKIYPDGCGSPF